MASNRVAWSGGRRSARVRRMGEAGPRATVADEAFLQPDVQSILITGNAVYGMAGMGVLAFFPLFFQVSLGESPTRAGLILASMSIAVTVGSYIAGRLTTGSGRYRRIVQVAPILSFIAMASFTFLDRNSDPLATIPWLSLLGLSMGLAFPTMTTATQNSLELPDLGAGTAAINFFRTLGQTVGVGAFGAPADRTHQH